MKNSEQSFLFQDSLFPFKLFSSNMLVMDKKPNIILILSDDLGYETLGCYGGTSYKTPILDDLAKSGALFKECSCSTIMYSNQSSINVR